MSQIWRLGRKYEDIGGYETRHLWRCDLCSEDAVAILGKNDASLNAITPLRDVHHIVSVEEEGRSRSATPSVSTSSSRKVAIRTASTRVQSSDINKF